MSEVNKELNVGLCVAIAIISLLCFGPLALLLPNVWGLPFLFLMNKKQGELK